MATRFAVAHSHLANGREAGMELGCLLMDKLGEVPDIVIAFISSDCDQSATLKSLHETCRPKNMMGCSSAGEFTDNVQDEGLACALAISSDEMFFSVGLGRDLNQNCEGAAKQIVSSFQYADMQSTLYRHALLLADALAGHTEELIEHISQRTDGSFTVFGGGAGDNANFSRTPIFFGTEIYENAAVALEILSNKPIGVGSFHGWQPSLGPMLVTDADGFRLISLDGRPAVEVFQQYAQETQQVLDLENPIPFFLHNVLGVEAGVGLYKLRVPLTVDANGAITCAVEIPKGAVVSIMSGSVNSTVDAASTAAVHALQQLHSFKPGMVLFFDCVATRLRMGLEFHNELQAVRSIVGADYIGCNTHGQVVCGTGQFSGFHNCTAVVCVFPA
ncbi:FIST signal transduction protein [Ktedonospora formicarum]|uniref:FIST domain protein n=1 Tax=Ktedonospora formicarum TaxID=2778364 RepID=A0A8J3HY20_9CHLR|nr:FIST N-terminal domain-containing protein [Ktedonospora formicarum]GHO45306.1 hypothetical protein KSX_34690 [Ktedonospora formicarum]